MPFPLVFTLCLSNAVAERVSQCSLCILPFPLVFTLCLSNAVVSAKSPHCFSCPCSTEAVGIAHKPPCTAFERYNICIISTGLPRPGLARSAHGGRIKLLRGYVSKSSAALSPLAITQLACELSMRGRSRLAHPIN